VKSPEEALTAIFTLAGAESVHEVRVAGETVYRASDHERSHRASDSARAL